MIHQIELTATLQRVVDIEAETLAEALDIAKEWYDDEQIVLDSSDLTDINMTPYEDEKI